MWQGFKKNQDPKQIAKREYEELKLELDNLVTSFAKRFDEMITVSGDEFLGYRRLGTYDRRTARSQFILELFEIRLKKDGVERLENLEAYYNTNEGRRILRESIDYLKGSTGRRVASLSLRPNRKERPESAYKIGEIREIDTSSIELGNVLTTPTLVESGEDLQKYLNVLREHLNPPKEDVFAPVTIREKQSKIDASLVASAWDVMDLKVWKKE